MALKKKKIAIAGVGTVGKGLLRILEVMVNGAQDIEITAIASRKKIIDTYLDYWIVVTHRNNWSIFVVIIYF